MGIMLRGNIDFAILIQGKT